MDTQQEQQIEHFWTVCPLPVKQILMLIAAECDAACIKHPNWPMDIIHQAAIVQEESGELIRAALQTAYEKGDPEEMAKEAIQTGAMAMRFLINQSIPDRLWLRAMAFYGESAVTSFEEDQPQP